MLREERPTLGRTPTPSSQSHPRLRNVADGAGAQPQTHAAGSRSASRSFMGRGSRKHHQSVSVITGWLFGFLPSLFCFPSGSLGLIFYCLLLVDMLAWRWALLVFPPPGFV